MNKILEAIFSHRSVRSFDTAFVIPEEDIELIIKAGQQASTSCTGQMYTILEVTKDKRVAMCGEQKFISEASFFGIICVDLHRLHRLVEQTGGENPHWPMAGFSIGTFDAGLFAQNIALAAEALGYDICFAGTCGDMSKQIIEEYDLPELVMPLTGIAIGKGSENPPVRPRLPVKLIHHKNKYKKYTEEDLQDGINQMNKGMDEEGYYLKYTKRENFSWNDHIKRKFGGKWLERIQKSRLISMKEQKFLD